MVKEYKVKEIFNANEKNIEEKLEAVFISFLIEKITNTEQIEKTAKSIE